MNKELITVFTENSEVGECPLWDAKTGIFRYLDIRGKCIWAKESDDFLKIALPQQIGCMALCENGDLLLGLEDAVYRMDKSGNLTRAHQEIKLKGRRINDGKVGPDGAFYFGTTDSNGEGAFYRLCDGFLTELFENCQCSNGIDWTYDGKHMYYIDSPKHLVEIFDFDITSGKLSNRRPFVSLPETAGLPDGMTLDENDNLWIALWDGGRVICIDTKTAKITDEIPVPCPKVSCCTFGGQNLSDIYITTAAMTDTENFSEAGNVFKTNMGVKGKSIYYYKY